jgi:hypothetical protein
MDLSTFKQLIELGWPAIVTFMFGYLALRYLNDMKDQIAYLRKRIDDLETRTDKVERARLTSDS